MIATDLHVQYGGIVGLQGVTVDVPDGSFVCVLGANGAGKSSLVRAIAGVLSIQHGSITSGSVEFPDAARRPVVGAGIGLVPEGRKIFASLTVEENLLCGAVLRRDRKSRRDDLARMWQLFPRLQERRSQLAGSLSGGEQQMVAISRALMGRPQLLICDELSLGLAPKLVESLYRQLSTLNQESGISVLCIEQNAAVALKSADYGYVLESGRVALEGSAEELRQHAGVQDAYLGGMQ